MTHTTPPMAPPVPDGIASRKDAMKLKILALVALVAVGVGAVAIASGAIGANAASGPQYLTADATVGDLTDDVAATGALAASESYGLVFGADPYVVGAGDAPASDTTWPVKKVNVAVGDTVAAGDVLATAETADLQRQLAAATDDLRSAQIQLAIAQETLDAATTTDTERQAKLGLYAAQNQHSQATEARQAIQAKIKAATLKAPIAGTVTAVSINAGFDAPAGPAIVVSSTTFEVSTDVVESDLANIKVGQTASVTISALDTTVDGTVSAISPVVGDSTSGVVSYPVTVTLKAPPSAARAGMSADVTITTASATGVLTVPIAALQGTAGAYAVTTLAPDGTTQRTPVDVGLVTSTGAEIKSGITDGTAVVTGTASDLIGTATGGTGAFPRGGGIAIPGGGGFQRGGGAGN
jgi:macrolide-specific efflux system membrane fusion protein